MTWPTDEWRLSDDIHVDRFCSFIATADGRLPVGPHIWQMGATDAGAQCTCRAELLIGEVAVAAAERRVAAAAAEMLAVKLEAVKAQLAGATVVTVSGCPASLSRWGRQDCIDGTLDFCNDCFYPAGNDEHGWPSFQNVHGYCLFHSPGLAKWFLSSMPGEKLGLAWVGAPDGLLPVGEREWQCSGATSAAVFAPAAICVTVSGAEGGGKGRPGAARPAVPLRQLSVKLPSSPRAA